MKIGTHVQSNFYQNQKSINSEKSNLVESLLSPNIAKMTNKKPPIYSAFSASKHTTNKLNESKNKSRLDTSNTINQNGVDEDNYLLPNDNQFYEPQEESDEDIRPDLIVNDHNSDKSEVEDDLEFEEDGVVNRKVSRGQFMSPERTPSFFKLNNNNRKVNEEELFTPNHILNKSKGKLSKTDLKSKKLLENKSADFKKKKLKTKSSKKITNLNENKEDVDNDQLDDVKFNSKANLLEDATLSDSNVNKLKYRSLSKDVLKTKSKYKNNLVTESQISTQESIPTTKQEIKVKDTKAVILLNSIFLERPKVLFFQQPKALGLIKDQKNRTTTISDKENKVNLKFRVENAHRYNSVLNNLKKSCFIDCKNEKWNLLWCCVVRSDLLRELSFHQKVNHFPHSFQLGRKDLLQRNYSQFRRKLPKDFDQCPQTQLLPYEYDRFKSDQAEERNPNQLWIIKPFNMACGKGIRVIGKKNSVKNRNHTLISKQIMKPHLINNFKQDLRVQIVITSFDPLRIYKFHQGLVRFATHEYKVACRTDRFSHLTNYSVNKKSATQNASKNLEDDSASKWTYKVWIEQLKNHCKCDINKLEHQIRDVCIKSCITIEPQVQNSVVSMNGTKNNCFEVQGFDVMIDKDFKPWIIEVNVLPSLSSSSFMDKCIKTSLMGDTLTLIGMSQADAAEKTSKRDQNLPEIQKTIKRTQRRKYLPDLENAPKLIVIDSQYKNGKIDQDALRRDIDAGNYLLNEEDLEILFETEEENYRRGNLERIFPPKDVTLMTQYNNLYQNKRFNTLLLLKFMKQPDILDKVATRISYDNV